MYFKEQPHHPHLPAQNHAQKEYHLRERERERERISAASFALCSCAPESSSRASSRAVFQRKRIKKTFALGKSYPEEGRVSLSHDATREQRSPFRSVLLFFFFVEERQERTVLFFCVFWEFTSFASSTSSGARSPPRALLFVPRERRALRGEWEREQERQEQEQQQH